MPNNTHKWSMDAQEQNTNAQKQVYDNIFKRLIEGQFVAVFSGSAQSGKTTAR